MAKGFKMKMRVTKKGDAFDKIQKAILKANGSYVTIGVHNDAGEYPDGQMAADIARYNEFGTKNIPARPFLRNTLYNRSGDIKKLIREMIKGVAFDGKSINSALTIIGVQTREMIRSTIKSNMPPKNAPSTLADKKRKKQGQKTLMATRLLLRSIAYKVHISGKE